MALRHLAHSLRPHAFSRCRLSLWNGLNVFQPGARVLEHGGILYAERRVVGYSAPQMFAIVNDVERYSEFLSYCTQSRALRVGQRSAEYELCITYPPLPLLAITDSYISRVTWLPDAVVHARSNDGRMFHKLDTTWRFGPNMQKPDCTRTCTIHFSTEFEFKYPLYARLSRMFFGSVVKSKVEDFLQRARELYGAPIPVDPDLAVPQILSYRNRG